MSALVPIRPVRGWLSMFDFSWSELLVVGIVALVFIGPKGLSDVLRALGQWIRGLKS
jgi:sec-independent protein translocase protein TatB